MKLDGRLGGTACDGGGAVYGSSAGLGDNGDRPERPPTSGVATTAVDDHGLSSSSSPPPPREQCGCDTDVRRQAMATCTAAGSAAVPKTSAVGSSLFTIDSILAPSRSSDDSAVAAASGRNSLTAATAAATGFFKQPLSFGHLAAAAAASGYAHSTAANFLGKFSRRILACDTFKIFSFSSNIRLPLVHISVVRVLNRLNHFPPLFIYLFVFYLLSYHFLVVLK